MQQGEQDVSELEETNGLQIDDSQNEVIESDGAEEIPKDETADQAYERIVNGKKSEKEAGDEGQGEQEAETDDANTVKDDKPKEEDRFDSDLMPPDRLDARGKKMFSNLPKHLRREYHRAMRSLEHGNSSLLTQERNSINQERQRLQGIHDAIAPYVEHVGSLGLTMPQAISELFAKQIKLTDRNRDKREEEFTKLAAQADVDLVKIAKKITGGSSNDSNGIVDISQHPQYLELKNTVEALRNQVNPVLSTYQQQVSAHEQQRIDEMAREYTSLVNEAQPNGQRRYDRLATDVEFRERQWKPLVLAILGNAPSLPVKEAYRQAYQMLTGSGGEAQNLNQTRSPIKQNNLAQTANVSVRGKTHAGSVAKPELTPPPGLDAQSEYEFFINQR